MHQDYIKSFFEDDIAAYFNIMFDRVIRHINGGDICDLGAHGVGHFWAMGYIERVNSYACYDLSAEALNIFSGVMAELDGAALENQFGDTLPYLRDIGLVSSDAEALSEQLKAKLRKVQQFDFLKDHGNHEYDLVLAMESLPVVDSYDDLLRAVSSVKSLLKPGGLALNISGQHVDGGESVKALQAHKLDGRLNPSLDVFIRAFEECGFTIIESASMPIDFPDYLTADYCIAQAAS